SSRLTVVSTESGNQAIRGEAPNGNAVVGYSERPGYAAVAGINPTANAEGNVGGVGVYGEANQGNMSIGVWGKTSNAIGVLGDGFFGVRGQGYYGVHGTSNDPQGSAFLGIGSKGALAAKFEGDVNVVGLVEKTASVSKIDHPLDPENKYLIHSSVESSEMKNVYDGEVTTDDSGIAEVALPDWFETLNRDFRYQLTVIDTRETDEFVLAKVTREIADNRFTIRTSQPNIKVCWQVTGVRQDPWAKKNPIQVEEEKKGRDRGKYLMPDLYGQSKEAGISYVPQTDQPAIESGSPLGVQ
ncbi:MAG: hypothetical protein KC931_25390, partial [Candidatus Omnitrophica bacterium]|nr:hypothetical protein [Candidatus Omnitrophota bacterium]